MASKVLILSKNDQYHKLEALGSMIVEWSKELKNVDIKVSHENSVLSELDGFDLCVLCITASDLITERESQALADFVASGNKLLAVHSATVIDEKNLLYIGIIGARFVTHSPYHEFPVKITDPEHPVTKGIKDFSISDELYVLDREPENAHVLASTVWDNKPQPMVYVKDYGKGKVIYIAMGHDEAAFNNPAYRGLIIQGMKWLLG